MKAYKDFSLNTNKLEQNTVYNSLLKWHTMLLFLLKKIIKIAEILIINTIKISVIQFNNIPFKKISKTHFYFTFFLI